MSLAAVLADQILDPATLEALLDELHRRGELSPTVVALAHARHLREGRVEGGGKHRWRVAPGAARRGPYRCARCGRWKGEGAQWIASATLDEATAVLQAGAGDPQAGGCPGRAGAR